MWAKLDDGFHDHQKTQAVTCAATGLLCRALSWSMRHLTGGWVPETQIKSLAGLSAAESDAMLTELVRVRSLDPLEKDGARGWMIHDIHDYNPTPSAVRRMRKERAEAGSKGGKQTASKRQANAKQVLPPCSGFATSTAEAKPNPDPTRPDPQPSKDQIPGEVAGKSTWITPYLDIYGEVLNEKRAENDLPPLVGDDLASPKDIKALCQYLGKRRPTADDWRARVVQWLSDAWASNNGLTRLRDFADWHQRQIRKMAPGGSD